MNDPNLMNEVSDDSFDEAAILEAWANETEPDFNDPNDWEPMA